MNFQYSTLLPNIYNFFAFVKSQFAMDANGKAAKNGNLLQQIYTL